MEPYTPTEAERIEIARRSDIAQAVARRAVGLFSTKRELEGRHKALTDDSQSKWLWVFFFGGILLNEFLKTETNKYTWAIPIPLLAGLYWLGKQFEQYENNRKLQRCLEQLNDLRVLWSSATGDRDCGIFWTLENVNDSMFDEFEFDIWWRNPRDRIIWQSCGYENGGKYTDHLEIKTRGVMIGGSSKSSATNPWIKNDVG